MPTRSVTLRILGDDLSARHAIDWVNAQSDRIDSRRPTLRINADASPAMGRMAELRAAIAALTDHMNSVKFDANDSKFNATLASMIAKLTGLQALGNRPILSDKMLAQTKADVLGLAAAFDKLRASQEATAMDAVHLEALQRNAAQDSMLAVATARNNAYDNAIFAQTDRRNQRHDTAVAALPGFPLIGPRGGGGAGGIGGWLGLPASIPLFGGVAAIGGTHLALDIGAELTASLGGAAIAATAFIAALTALAPTVNMMYQRENAMYTATDVLGQGMYGLGGTLNKVNAEFRPQVFQLWGDALTVANGGAGTLEKLLQTVMPWLDKFAARITVDLTSGTGTFMNIVRSGTGYLGQFGSILHSIGDTLAHFFSVSEHTHIASDLLGIVAVAAHLLDVITRPGWVQWGLELGLGLHGAYIYGGLAFQGISKIAGVLGAIPGLGGLKALGNLPATLDRMAVKGLEAGGSLEYVAVKGLRGLALDAAGAEVKTGLFKTSLAALSQVPVWGWVAAGALAVGGLVFWMSRAKDSTQSWIATLNSGISNASNAQVFNKLVEGLGKTDQKFSDTSKTVNTALSVLGGYVNIASNATIDQGALAGETGKLTTQMTNFAQGTAWIMKTWGVDYPTAIALATKAGVSLNSNITGTSKAAQDARQQIIGLMSGFEQLQGPSGIAGKDFQALAIASNDITTKIGQLNSAWSQMVSTVSGPQTAVDTFAQGLDVLNNQAGNFTLRLGVLSTTGTRSKAAIDSLSASGVNLNQAFAQEVANAGNVISAMRTTGASQDAVTKTTKAAVAALIPYAAGSKEATAQLSLLAQEANGPTTTSIKVLSDWAGVKASNALGNMKSQADKATVAASNLANTLQNLLNIQFQNDIVQASGADKALQRYTTDLVNNKQQTAIGRNDRQNLIDDLIKAGVNADKARQYVDGLSTSIGKVPPNTSANIFMNGKGQYTISGTQALLGMSSNGPLPTPTGHSAGWRVPGYGGGDRHLALLEGGEAVVPKHLTPGVATYLGAHGVPGFTAGGFVGSGSYSGNIPGLTSFTAGMLGTFQNDLTGAMVAAMRAGIQQIGSMFAGQVANVGSGVMRWRPFVFQALAMEGLPPWLTPQVLLQMQTESGGNPNAINLTDSNAAAGDPSRGLLQTIATTFSAYHWPGTSWNIYDPLANIAAAINYARHTYGPTLMSGGMGMGSGHGYALGGPIIEPIMGIGASGQRYSFGENGPEWVTPLTGPGASSAAPGSGAVNIYVEVNAGDAVDPNAVAQAIHQMLRRYKLKKGNQSLGFD